MNTNEYTSNSAVIAFFNNPTAAENAISSLRAVGFSADQIGCSYDDSYAATDTAGTVGTAHDDRSFWDKVGDFFTGSDESSRTTESDLSVPERYYDRLKTGGAFVSVYGGSRTAEAERVLKAAGGEVERDLSSFRPIASGVRGSEAEHRIQLLSERLRVHKERVSQGDVRLRKEVHTEHKTIDVPVTREEIVVEHVPTSERSASGRDIGEKEIRVPLSEERVRVEKEPVVRDEVRVSKRPVQEVKKVTDEVRHEELNVDDERKQKPPRKTA